MKQQTVFVMKNVKKRFPISPGENILEVLENITLKIYEGETVALLGPSGCGKSTILNIAGGFEGADEGNVSFEGQPVTQPSKDRGVVFQSAVLFPWLTVNENIAYGLKLQKLKGDIIASKCKKYIELVELEGFENYYPNQLSGGMQQRVALARVLILEPKMLLMDEPFAALDAQTRMSMQEMMLDISMKINLSAIFVTHDVEEALILADRIYVMSKLPGRIIREIYVPFEKPRGLSIIGQPEFTKVKSEILEMLLRNKI